MKYDVVPSNQFKKDVKLAKKRGCDLEDVRKVIKILAEGKTLKENIEIIC